MSVKLIIEDEINIKFVNLPLEMRKLLAAKFKYEVPHARYQPYFRLGRWDGKVSLFGLGGTGYMFHLEEILKILEENNIFVTELEDRRDQIDLTFNKVTETYWADRGKVWPVGHPDAGKPIMLRDYQVNAINSFLENTHGINVICTGGGKTIITATLSHNCERIGRTVVIVPNKSLVVQTEEDYLLCGLDTGVYFGGRKDLDKTHTICTWQSLSILGKKGKDSEDERIKLATLLHGVKTVIVDECHGTKGAELKFLLTNYLNNACIRWGLTGTLPPQEYEKQLLFTSIGPEIGGIKSHELQELGVLSTCQVNVLQLIDYKEFRSYDEEIKFLSSDTARLEFISKSIVEIAKSGNTLVLVNRIDTGKALEKFIPNSTFISGADKVSERKEAYDEIKSVDNKVLIATFGVASTGINILRLFNLVMIEPGKSYIKVIQSIGRGLRKGLDKDNVQIWDVSSTCRYSKRHLTERKRFYKDSKWPIKINKIDWSQ